MEIKRVFNKPVFINFDGILRRGMNITMMDFCPSRRDIKHCMLSASESCEKIFTGDSGGIRTHDLLLTSADVLTTRPPSLPMASGRFEPRIAAGTAIDINFDGILNIFSQDSESTEHTVLNITSGRAKIHHCHYVTSAYD